MKVTEKDVTAVADLANLELTAAERERMVKQLFSSFHATANTSRWLSIFFIFARARNARTLMTDRLQPVIA